MNEMETSVLIIGAGPAGLTAAYQLASEGIAVTVLEADSTYVGGIAKTASYKGYSFDIGGHRFYSKSEKIERFWSDVLPNDMLQCPRSSRILYRGKFYAYPLAAVDALLKLGFVESLRCLISYFYARLAPVKDPLNFTDWVSNRFGKRLFSTFFKTYTEKVWGMRCDDISADWAAQRIKGLSLTTAIANALWPFSSKGNHPTMTTLINHFRYPRKGPGMLWDACAEKIKQRHGHIYLGCTVFKLAYLHEPNRWEVSYTSQNGETNHIYADHVISSAPLRDVASFYLQDSLTLATKRAASMLKYRDFLIVVLILRDKNIFNDQWIYIHDSQVDVARIQNFKAWSAEMVPDPSMNCYGMEYFCFEDNDFWVAPDASLIAKATHELIQLGLAQRDDILDGCVLRQSKAYPVYDHHYRQCVRTIREELSAKFPTLHLVGRNGMHKYNNQDHSMMTAMLTVDNILAGSQQYDVWRVNQDADYIESSLSSERSIPSSLQG